MLFGQLSGPHGGGHHWLGVWVWGQGSGTRSSRAMGTRGEGWGRRRVLERGEGRGGRETERAARRETREGGGRELAQQPDQQTNQQWTTQQQSNGAAQHGTVAAAGAGTREGDGRARRGTHSGTGDAGEGAGGSGQSSRASRRISRAAHQQNNAPAEQRKGVTRSSSAASGSGERGAREGTARRRGVHDDGHEGSTERAAQAATCRMQQRGKSAVNVKKGSVNGNRWRSGGARCLESACGNT